jgi:hypothetical protein
VIDGWFAPSSSRLNSGRDGGQRRSSRISEPAADGPGDEAAIEHSGFKVAARCDELALRLYRALTEGQDEAIERLVAAKPVAPNPLRP